jgi:hypothetical protein
MTVDSQGQPHRIVTFVRAANEPPSTCGWIRAPGSHVAPPRGGTAAIIPQTMEAKSTRQTLRTVEPAITDAVREEFSEFAAGLDGSAERRATVDAFGEFVRGFDLDPGTEIASRIEGCVAKGRAASFIRLGDGEGNLVALELDDYPALTQYCIRSTSVRHLGSAGALPNAASEVLPAFRAALRNAELIGIPRPFGAKAMLRGSAPETFFRPIYGVVSIHRYLTRFAGELQLGRTTGAPAGFHRLLLPFYEALISGRAIGIVTCHPELQHALQAKLGASAVDLRLVPRQAKFSEDPLADTDHWPDRFHELSRELRTIEPGILWLVAAGMLGKIYCDVIRAAGGIAVDIGHVADIWAGVKTRSYDQAETIAAWSIV